MSDARDADNATDAGEGGDGRFDPHDRKQVQDRQKQVRQRVKRADAALSALMKTQDGRILIWDLLKECRVFQPTFSASNPHQTSYNEGQRNVGLNVLSRVMRACPTDFLTMQTENGSE